MVDEVGAGAIDERLEGQQVQQTIRRDEELALLRQVQRRQEVLIELPGDPRQACFGLTLLATSEMGGIKTAYVLAIDLDEAVDG